MSEEALKAFIELYQKFLETTRSSQRGRWDDVAPVRAQLQKYVCAMSKHDQMIAKGYVELLGTQATTRMNPTQIRIQKLMKSYLRQKF